MKKLSRADELRMLAEFKDVKRIEPQKSPEQTREVYPEGTAFMTQRRRGADDPDPSVERVDGCTWVLKRRRHA